MRNIEKDLSKLIILVTIDAILFVCVMFRFEENYLIINLGIRAYRIIHAVALAALLSVTGMLLGRIIIRVRKNSAEKRENRNNVRNDVQKPYENGTFNNAALRNILLERKKTWSSLAGEIDEIIEQLQKMDDMQERLHTLLMDNDADVLSDTEDVLNQVDQFLCRNVYSCINFMNVYDARADDDIKAMWKTLHSGIDRNKKELDNVQEFMLALAEYINKQNGLGKDTSALETYKDIILKSLNDQ